MRKRHNIIRPVIAMVATAAVAGGGIAAVALPSSATPRHVRFELVRGTFTSPPVPLTNVHLDGDVPRFDLSGGDHWKGDVRGSTTWSGSGSFDQATGNEESTVHETFTGTADGFGTGTLSGIDVLETDAQGMGNVYVSIIGGTGDLKGVTGSLTFTTTQSSVDGNGNISAAGYYTGELVR
jgi:hypothetical protein